jgi:hypothetical protein
MVQTFETAVEKSVNFWVEKTFNTPNNQNNGDAFQSGMANMLADILRKKVKPDMANTFKEKLTKILLTDPDFKKYGMRLTVDYDPGKWLHEACEQFGVNPGLLPIKSATFINRETLEVLAYYGYGSHPGNTITTITHI